MVQLIEGDAAVRGSGLIDCDRRHRIWRTSRSQQSELMLMKLPAVQQRRGYTETEAAEQLLSRIEMAPARRGLNLLELICCQNLRAVCHR